MVLTNRDSTGITARSAFFAGFMRGLGGPTMLFSPTPNPSPAKAILAQISTPAVDPVDAVRADWVIIGTDINTALTTYAKTFQK